MDARRRPAAEVIWTPGAEAALLRLTPWGATERAARAVYELAATGRGNLRRRGTSPTEFSLYVSSICIRLSFERGEAHHRLARLRPALSQPMDHAFTWPVAWSEGPPRSRDPVAAPCPAIGYDLRGRGERA